MLVSTKLLRGGCTRILCSSYRKTNNLGTAVSTAVSTAVEPIVVPIVVFFSSSSINRSSSTNSSTVVGNALEFF